MRSRSIVSTNLYDLDDEYMASSDIEGLPPACQLIGKCRLGTVTVLDIPHQQPRALQVALDPLTYRLDELLQPHWRWRLDTTKNEGLVVGNE